MPPLRPARYKSGLSLFASRRHLKAGKLPLPGRGTNRIRLCDKFEDLSTFTIIHAAARAAVHSPSRPKPSDNGIK
jgi:hypothetical protein